MRQCKHFLIASTDFKQTPDLSSDPSCTFMSMLLLLYSVFIIFYDQLYTMQYNKLDVLELKYVKWNKAVRSCCCE